VADPSRSPLGPRARRRRQLAAFLRAALVAVLVLAVVALVLPADGVAHAAAVGMVVVLVAAPVVRVAWLTGRWWRLGDRRYAGAGAALLAVVAVGLVLAS
jgi:membrane protease YdiL (CAAX protease family)